RLERSRKEGFLVHWLRALTRVDARAAEIQQSLDVVQVRRVDDGRMNHHVVVEKLGWTDGIRQDPAHRAGDQEHILWSIRAKPIIHRRLIAEIELLAGRQEELIEPLLAQATNDRGSYETAMTRNENPGRSIHRNHSSTPRLSERVTT